MPLSSLRAHLLDPFTPGVQRPDRSHIVELDSLRGVAALIVVFTHFAEGWFESSPPHFLNYLPYVPFVISGPAAVMLFFVLSGFVLTLPMLSGKQQAYPSYAVRRICRIYLPYVAALMVALACCWKFHGLEMYGAIFHTIWRSPPSLTEVAEHLAFLGRYDVYALNPPIWSLVHEMRISLIFPLLCLVSLRLRSWAAFAIALMFPIAGRLVEKYSAPYMGDGVGTHRIFWAATVGFCGVFLIGSMLARYREPLVARAASLPMALRWLLAAFAVVLFQYSELLHVPRFIRDFGIGLASAYFVIMALTPGGLLSRLLRLAPIRFVGRISYSLYLVHVPILMVMSIAIWGKGISYGLLFLPYLAISILASAVFYRVVEQPSIALGKAISRKWAAPAPLEPGGVAVGDEAIVAGP